MGSSTFGKVFTLTTFGESHGIALGGVIDGCPPNLKLDIQEIQNELDRRKPGQSKIVTQRKEADQVEILSGIFEGKTTGTPIGFVIRNNNQRSKDYNHIKDQYRPSHADYTYDQKYGHRDYRGGGRSSARETACRVVGGAIAKQLLAQFDMSIQAYVNQVGELKLNRTYSELDLSRIEDNIVRCPDEDMAKKMIEKIDSIRKQGNTIGGVITCVVKGTPAGLGEPVFDKLHAELGKAMLGINAVKGFEYGSGFEGAKMTGKDHNDLFAIDDNQVKTSTNYSGGIQGGISNGEDIYFNVAFKPVATIMRDQDSIDNSHSPVTVSGKGRHDPCVLPRAVPIVEAMTALTLADFLLRNRTYNILTDKQL